MISRKIEMKKYKFFIFAIFSFIIYFNSLNNAFVLDDIDLIVNNSYVKNIGHFPRIFLTNIFQFSSTKESNYYRPIQIATYFFDYIIWKLKPLGYHLTNVILHFINSYLIYKLLFILFGKFSVALMTGILYCVSPFHTSVVGYISGRADILVSMFMILSIIKFLRYLTSQEIKGYILSIIFFCLALLSRENSLLLPFLVILTYLIKGTKRKFISVAILSFFVVEALYILSVRFYLIGDLKIFYRNFKEMFSPFILINIINVFKKYFTLLIYPSPLYLMRTAPFIENLKMLDLLSIFLFILLIPVLVLKDKEKIISFGILWFIFTLLPVVITNIYFFSEGIAMSENWLYMPSVGFFVVVSYFLCSLQKKQKIFSFFIFIFLFCFYSILTLSNNRNWKDELTLYKHILKFSPNNYTARINLANFYYEQGLYEKAKEELQVVLSKDPTAWDAFVQLGLISIAEGNLTTALEFNKRAIEFNPKCSQAYNNLGIVYKIQNRDKESFDAFLKALEINPELWQSYVGLGDLFMERRLYGDAVRTYKKALELNPDNESIYLKIGLCYGEVGQYKKTLSVLYRALKLSPNSIEIMNVIGITYGNMGDFDNAIKMWKRILLLDPDNEEVRENIKKALHLQTSPN